MIDDITIGLALPEGLRVNVPDVLHGRDVVVGTEHNNRRRREVEFKLHRRHGMVLKHVGEADEVILKLSLPRLLGNQPYNFPLHPVRSIDDIDLVPVVTFVREALGIAELPAPLDRWPVIRWAAALDVDVGDAGLLSTMHGLFTVQRGHAGHAQSWTNRNGLTGIQWGTKGNRRAMVYNKAAEILERTPRRTRSGQEPYGRLEEDRLRERDARRALAEQAANILRFEVTLDAAKPIRKVFNWEAPATPTFRLMAREDVQHLVLGQELRRLQLFGLAELDDGEVDHPDIVEVLRQLIVRIQAFNVAAPDAEHFGLSAAYRLAMFHLTDGLVRRRQVVEWNNGSGTSTLSAMRADLRLLGLAPLAAAPGLDHHRWLVRFARSVRERLTDIPEEVMVNVHDAYRDGLAADAPWCDLLRDAEGMRLDPPEEDDGIENEPVTDDD